MTTRKRWGKREYLNGAKTKELERSLDKLIEEWVEIPRIRYGSRQALGTLRARTNYTNITKSIHSTVFSMSETLKSMEIFTKFGLQRLRWIIENLDDEVFDWKMTRQSNPLGIISHIYNIECVFPQSDHRESKLLSSRITTKVSGQPISLYKADPR
jgi:hypothetical protein